MTDRTIQDVDNEINEIEQQIIDYRFIAGDTWCPVIVTFAEEDGLDDELKGSNWREEFKAFKRGERVGVTEVIIHGRDTTYLSAKDLTKINLHKAIVDGLLFTLADLRKERHELKQQTEESN